MNDDRIDAETIRTLASLLGIAVPDEDVDPLAVALTGQLAAGRRILDRYGDRGIEPPLVFDPRWR
jgi:hypothetical protein